MNFLTKAQLLAVQARRFGEIDVPELGGALRVGGLTAAKMLEFKALQAKGADVQAGNVFLLRHGCVDEQKKPIFAKDEEVIRVGPAESDAEPKG